MEKEFNEQESLRLITNMIADAKGRFQKNSGSNIILWGYCIAILALANFILLQVLEGEGKAFAYCVWICTIPLFIVNYLNEGRKARKSNSKNYIEFIAGNVWLGFFISTMIFVASVFILSGVYRSNTSGLLFVVISPMIMSITGLCLFINGLIYRFKPFVYGSAIFWVSALLSALVLTVWEMQHLQFLILSICMVFGFILPGHILYRKSKEDV
ncbi:MAG: hypothetical protein LBB84_04285 [Tannerellaceae bacterium]|jgi:hypothetical protein|nr:hypothetical protein [Tannerellaceae bacterium]